MLHQMPHVVLFSHLVPRSKVSLTGAKDSSEELDPCGQEKPCAVCYDQMVSDQIWHNKRTVCGSSLDHDFSFYCSTLVCPGGIFIA